MSLSSASQRLCACLPVILGAALAARAAEKPVPQVDPQAQKAIDAMGKYYAQLKGFKVSVDIALNVEQQGQRQTQAFAQKISAERPNKFSCVLESGRNGVTIISDGDEMALFVQSFNKYAVEKAPASWAGILENPIVLGSTGVGNASGVMAALFSDDPAKKLVERLDAVEYGGLVDLNGMKCHLIKATGEEMDWQLWIDAGKEPLIRQAIPDLAKVFERMAKTQGGKSPFANMKISNVVTYKDWEINPKFPADAFAIHVPDGATKVGSFMEIVTGGRKPAEPELHALVGKPAPPVELELLDGGKLDLASYKNKKVVILDFWATWCGPCVRAMPIIEKVAEKYKEQGVLLFAVNQQEKPDEIQAFLDEAKLKVTVALDKDGEVGEAYKAEAIPQTVLVGKDGSVQVVRVGLSPNLEAELAKDLEALLAGKNLATEALAAAKAKQQAAEKEAAKEDKPEEKK